MPNEKIQDDDKKSRAAPFKCHGVELSNGNGDQLTGDCPFCEKREHFFVNKQTGQWDCKSCGMEGNVFTYLTEFSKKVHDETSQEDFNRLSQARGIPADAFISAKIGWNDPEWLIPIYSEKGTVRDIRRWDGDRTMSTAGCHLQLFGLDKLADTLGSQRRVWVCEGEWDAIALRWLLDQAGFRTDIVVGVPGAGSFKDEWVKWFKGHDIILCFDNDDPGDKGARKTAAKLADVANSILFLSWPDSRPLGWDIRDFVKEGRGTNISASEGVRILESLLTAKHRRDKSSSPEKGAACNSGKSGKPINFSELVRVYEKWVKVDDDFKDALAIALATVVCTDLPGEPLWMYIVGPPSSGKTVILMSLKNFPKVFFQSTFTPASLISGYNTHPDPSIIPKMDGKTAVFKDGTELLAMHPDARREAYGTLRGAYDGYASKPFGNSVGTRSYTCHFNMLIGVTPAIHGDNQATMGERFLKFEMREDQASITAKMRMAISNISKELEMEAELGDVSCRFLQRTIDKNNMPEIPELFIGRIIAVAQLVAILRAQVEKDAHTEDIKYRPTHELGTRIAKQLSKLAMALCIVFDKKKMDDDIYTMIERVSIDSMVGFHADIVITAMNSGTKGLTRDLISKAAQIPAGTCYKRLVDMEHLGIMNKIRDDSPSYMKRGPRPVMWRVSKHVRGLWKEAKLFYRTDVKMKEEDKQHA